MAAKPQDAVWKKLLLKVKEIADGPNVKVGVFGNVEKAAAHEFGTETVPERSFIRSTFEKKQPELAKMTAKIAKKVFEGGMEVEKGLSLLGEWGANECKNTIRNGPDPDWPALSSAYAEKKEAAGKTTVLVDTGEMINSITYKVEK